MEGRAINDQLGLRDSSASGSERRKPHAAPIHEQEQVRQPRRNADSLLRSCVTKVSDKREGHRTEAHFQRLQAMLGNDALAQRHARDARAKHNLWDPQSVRLSCWTTLTVESHRLWAEYGGSAIAVAVDTTVGALRTALGPEFLIVPVEYLKDENQLIPRNHSLNHTTTSDQGIRGSTKSELLRMESVGRGSTLRDCLALILRCLSQALSCRRTVHVSTEIAFVHRSTTFPLARLFSIRAPRNADTVPISASIYLSMRIALETMGMGNPQ